MCDTYLDNLKDRMGIKDIKPKRIKKSIKSQESKLAKIIQRISLLNAYAASLAGRFY